MEIRVIRKTENELILEIEGEDHTLGNLLVKEALNHPDIIYASYRIPHPLQNKLELYFTFRSKSDMEKVLCEIVENIHRYLSEFKKEVEEKIS
ncbi:MAG: RNA polymerase [Desulfurococcales archaeon ex4484_58]|nr:MAG: RNA polymerase [Desulfurococcales archaeon ex4484_58]